MFYFLGLSFLILMRAQRQNGQKKTHKKTKDTAKVKVSGQRLVLDCFLLSFART